MAQGVVAQPQGCREYPHRIRRVTLTDRARASNKFS